MLERVIGAVAGNVWNMQFMREAKKLLIHIFFVRQVMTLELDIKTPIENIVEPGKCFLSPTLFYLLMKKTVSAAGDREQMLRMFFYILTGCRVLAFCCTHLDRCDQPTKILIAL